MIQLPRLRQTESLPSPSPGENERAHRVDQLDPFMGKQGLHFNKSNFPAEQSTRTKSQPPGGPANASHPRRRGSSPRTAPETARLFGRSGGHVQDQLAQRRDVGTLVGSVKLRNPEKPSKWRTSDP